MAKYYVGIDDGPPKRPRGWLVAGLLVLALLALALCRGRGPAPTPTATGNGLGVETTTTTDTTVPADNAVAPTTGDAMQAAPPPSASSEAAAPSPPSSQASAADLHGAKLCRRSVGTDGTARIVCRNEAGEWRDALSGEAAPAPASDTPAPSAASAGPALVTNPDWVRRPNGDDLQQYYPDRAARLEQAGRVSMTCTVTETGSLTGCSIVSEDPPGFGFGEATLKIARFFQMRPKQVDGTPVGGATVTIPVRWTSGP